MTLHFTIEALNEKEKNEKRQSWKIIFFLGKQSNMKMKMLSLFFCAVGRNDEPQGGQSNGDNGVSRQIWQRNKGKGTHEDRKTNRMLAIHRDDVLIFSKLSFDR